MKYCLVENDKFARELHASHNVDWDNKNTLPPKALTASQRTAYGVKELIKAGPLPKFHTKGGVSYIVSPNQVTEVVEFIPFTPEAYTKIIKAEASRRILTIAPEWQQRNMLARASELLEIATFGGTLTPDQETERQNLGKGRAAIQAIRVKSNTLETSITNMTAVELAAFDPTLDTHWA